jgi:hypothetical protein
MGGFTNSLSVADCRRAAMSSQSERGTELDPFMLRQYLRLNEAIEQFTADMVAHDPKVFRNRSSDIRYVVERYLYFALVTDRKLYDYFVAFETGAALPDVNDLSIWGRQIAPYFKGARPAFAPRTWRLRCLRYLHRLHSRTSVQIEGIDGGRPQILFLVIQPKFVRYLKPIADALCVPYAFLTIDHTEMFSHLAEQGLPRVHVQMNVEWERLTHLANRMVGPGLRLGLFDSWILKLKALKRVLGTANPSCIVIPEGNADIYELANQAAKAADVPTLCVQQGWAPTVHLGFRNMSYDRMCVWGQKFADLLAPYNPKQRFVVTGSHVIACGSQGDIKTRHAIAFFLQNGAHWMSDATWRAMLDFVAWAAATFPDYEIRVRAHPGEPLRPADESRLGNAENLRRMPAGEFPLRDVLLGCRVAIAMTSTTILEAAASGTIPLILDVNGFGPYHPDIVSSGAAIEVKSFGDAREELERLVNDDQYCASFAEPLENARRGLFVRSGEEALNAIVAEINEIARIHARQ